MVDLFLAFLNVRAHLFPNIWKLTCLSLMSECIYLYSWSYCFCCPFSFAKQLESWSQMNVWSSAFTIEVGKIYKGTIKCLQCRLKRPTMHLMNTIDYLRIRKSRCVSSNSNCLSWSRRVSNITLDVRCFESSASVICILSFSLNDCVEHG